MANNSLIVGLLRLLAAAAQLIYARISIGYLGVESYSIFLIILSFSGWIAIADLGYGVSAQNKYSQNISLGLSNAQLMKDVSILQAGLLIFLTAPLILIALFVAKIVIGPLDAHTSSFPLAVGVGVLGWLISAIYGSIYRILYAMHKPFWANLPTTIAALISPLLLYGATQVSSLSEYNILICVLCTSLPMAVAAFASSIMILPVIRIEPVDLWNKFNKAVKSYSKDALQFSTFALVVCFSTNIDYIIISQTLTSLEISQYYIVTKALGVIYFFVYARMLRLWPVFAELIHRNDFDLIKSKIKSLTCQSLLFLGFSCGAMASLPGTISQLFSNGKVPIDSTLIMLGSVYFIIRSVVDLYSVILCSNNKSGFMALTLSLQAVVSAALQFGLSKYYGVPGLLVGLSAAFAVTSLWINPILFEQTVVRPGRLALKV